MKIFENTENAFSIKTNRELRRAYFLFTTIASPKLVKTGSFFIRFAFWFNLPIKRILKKTIFKHFCAGENEKEALEVVQKLALKGVASVLHYSVEGIEKESSFDSCLSHTLQTIALSKRDKNLPFIVFKPTGYGRFSLYEKVSQKTSLTSEEKKEWERVKERFTQTCDKSRQSDIKLLVDAEESWIQPAIDELLEEFMQKYNQKEAIVYTTLQMYRHDRLEYLKQLLKKAQEKKYIIGVKLVRGAYLEKENLRAKKLSYPTPICSSKKATDENYDRAVLLILKNLKNIAAYFGTHNENSILKILSYIKKNKISKKHPHLWFSQLYGMSDIISFNLAKENYQTAKYLPFGPVKKIIPYLIRRAQENTSIAGQTTRELELIKREIKRRKLKN